MFYSHYKQDLAAARGRVSASGSHVAMTECGPIEYIDCGDGLPVLWVHGVVGGSDQGINMSRMYIGEGFRIIAVSRFGYIQSPSPLDASPAAQADAYAALLDTLEISTAALVGTSAGTASCIHFALRHPNRCSALALWSMAAVQNRLTEPEQEWLAMVMRRFLPISLRVKGIINDICVSNPGMNENVEFESISVPVLIIHAEDDPMPPFAGAKLIAGRFPNARFFGLNFGGHLLVGNLERVRTEIMTFIKKNASEKLSP